jgi:hypothetical protein
MEVSQKGWKLLASFISAKLPFYKNFENHETLTEVKCEKLIELWVENVICWPLSCSVSCT